MTLQEMLQDVIDRAGWSQADVARETNIKKQYISNVYRNGSTLGYVMGKRIELLHKRVMRSKRGAK